MSLESRIRVMKLDSFHVQTTIIFYPTRNILKITFQHQGCHTVYRESHCEINDQVKIQLNHLKAASKALKSLIKVGARVKSLISFI